MGYSTAAMPIKYTMPIITKVRTGLSLRYAKTGANILLRNRPTGAKYLPSGFNMGRTRSLKKAATACANFSTKAITAKAYFIILSNRIILSRGLPKGSAYFCEVEPFGKPAPTELSGSRYFSYLVARHFTVGFLILLLHCFSSSCTLRRVHQR